MAVFVAAELCKQAAVDHNIVLAAVVDIDYNIGLVFVVVADIGYNIAGFISFKYNND